MRRPARGTTLPELMAALAIVGVLASLAVGFTGSYRREETLKEIARNVAAGMAQARAEAVRRSTRVHVDLITNGQVLIQAYTDRAGNFRYDPPADGIRIFAWPDVTDPAIPLPQPSVTSPTLMAANGHPTAIFDANGTSIDRTGQPLSATVCVTDPRLPRAPRAVQLSVAGATRVLAYAAAQALCP